MFIAFFDSLPVWAWIVILVGIILILLMVMEGIIRKNKKRRKIEADKGVVEHKDVRYSDKTDRTDAAGNEKATFASGDIVLSKGTTYTAGTKRDELKPGKYTILTAAEGINGFNIRLNGFVREYKHNSAIILGEGDTICPVSTSIVLR